MTGHSIGRSQHVGGYVRVALVTMLIGALFMIAPPAKALPVVVVSPTSVAVSEAGLTATYDVSLEDAPTADVYVTVADDSQVDVDKALLTFTPSDFGVQTVTVSAQLDSVAEGPHFGAVTHGIRGDSAAEYLSAAPDSVSVSITDDDTADVVVSPTSVSVVEGGASDSYDVVLTSEPSASVTVNVSAGSQVSVSALVPFTSANWDSAQTVTVTADDDDLVEGSHGLTITHSVTSSDSDYSSITPDSVSVSITDNDSADVVVSPTSVSVVEGGASDSYDVVLTSEPSASVTVNVSAGSQVSVSALVPFTSANWDSAQTVTVTADDDDLVEGSHGLTITHSVTSSDSDYSSITPDSVSVSITDNDSADVVVSPTSVSVVEGGASDSYDVVLTSEPTASVTVNVSAGSQVSVSALVPFTSANWDSAQTVTVTADDDDLVEGSHGLTITHSVTSSDSDYSSITPDSVSVSITDNDFAVSFVEDTSAQLEGDATTTADVDVILDTGGQDLTATATVQVVLTGGSATPGADFGFTSPTTLTFPAGSGDGTIRTATISVVGDALNEATETVALGLVNVSSNGEVVAPSGHTHSILDNDGPPGLSAINAPSRDEADVSLVFEVVLSAPPGQVVTVDYATASGTATAGVDYTATTGTLSFTPGGLMIQEVSVPILDDSVDEIAETVLLNLSNSPIADIVDPQAVGTITDDDNVDPTVSIRITDQAGAPGIEFETGEIVRLEVTVVDAGAADSHDVRLYWGDGTPVESFGVSPAARTFQRTHVYAAVGFETISVVVADEDGGSGSRDAFVNIVPSTGVGGGAHRTGLVDPGSGKWYLYNDAGTLVTQFYYGNPGDYPFMGDWDGDGIETPGLYRQSDGYVYLRNSNTVGIADIKFFFGDPGDVPIAGDFNGDGFDTVSIYRPSNQRFYIINELGSNDGGLGAADIFYTFGNPGDKPFVGDFDGDGVETAGLHRESTGLVYFRNTHTAGNAHSQFLFGDPGDRLVAGDWTGDGVFTPTLFRPSNTTVYFRYTNTQGNADNQFVPAPTNGTWLPVSGVTGF